MLRILTLPLRLLGFAGWFAWQILISSGRVIIDIVTPGSRATPRVVRLPLHDAGDGHIAAISMLITLTPGTLTLGVAPSQSGGRSILVHSMYHPDTQAALTELSEMNERMTRAASIGRRS